MNQGWSPLLKRLGMALVMLCLLVLPCSIAMAQQPAQDPKPGRAGRDDDDDKGPFSSVEEEMKSKLAVKFADREYQENLVRARDLSSLTAAIATSYKEKNRLDAEDLKKLGKIEKLAKGIRSAAGGSDDDFQLEKPPKDLPSAVTMLTDVSASLKESVEKTPKHVVSAAVIDQANVLLEVVRIVRTLPS